MKRRLLFILFIFLLANLGAAYKDLVSKPFMLQAGVKDVTEAYISRIPVQSSELFSIGMPFDIEDPYVQYRGPEPPLGVLNVFGSGSGRIIAEWSFISNRPFNIKIDAHPLEHETDKTFPPLTYSLAFEFNLNYLVDKNGVVVRDQKHGYVAYEGKNNETFIRDVSPGIPESEAVMHDGSIDGVNNPISMSRIVNAVNNTFLGAAKGRVYFGFTYESTQRIKDAPVGNYIGVVNLIITPEV